MKKKKHKYNYCLGDGNYKASRDAPADTDIARMRQPQDMRGSIPPPMALPIRSSPGFCLGMPSGPGRNSYIGILQGTEGNIMVVGGNGSNKSTGVAMPTLKTWRGAICATDVKGELSEFYERLYQEGLVTRPCLVFDPMQSEGPGYDPFDWLLEDDEANLIGNI